MTTSTKTAIAATAVVAATNPITVVACIFNPVLAVAVVAGVAATVKACEVRLDDTLVDLAAGATLEVRELDREMSIQYNDEPEVAFDVDAELEALRKELEGAAPINDPELEALKKELGLI